MTTLKKGIVCGAAALALGVVLGVVSFLHDRRVAAPDAVAVEKIDGPAKPVIAETPKKVITPAAPIVPKVELPIEVNPAAPVEVEKPAVPAAPALPEYTAIDLSKAFNSGFVGALARATEGSDEGVPLDGRVAIPGILPRAYFVVSTAAQRNAIELSGLRKTAIPGNQRSYYGRISILHGTSGKDRKIAGRLHYTSGEDERIELHVLNWKRQRRENYFADHLFLALQTTLNGKSIDLFSQTFNLDPTRILDSIVIDSTGADADSIIFGVTAIDSEEKPFRVAE